MCVECVNDRPQTAYWETSGVPYWVLRTALDKDLEMRKNVFNKLVSFIDNGKLTLVYQVNPTTIRVGVVDNEFKEGMKYSLSGVIQSIRMNESTVWNLTESTKNVILVRTDNEVNIFYITDNKIIFIKKYHSTSPIRDAILSQSDSIYLIFITDKTVDIINTEDDSHKQIELESRSNEYSLCCHIFPHLYYSKNDVVYDYNIITREVTPLKKFNDNIVAMKLCSLYPFNLVVVTVKSVILFDIRTKLGVLKYDHLVPNLHLMRDVEINVIEDDIVVIVSSREYSIIVRFEYSKIDKMFKRYAIGSSFNLPIALPLKKKKEHYILSGISLFIHNKQIVVIMLDSQYRITMQKYAYSDKKKGDFSSLISTEVGGVERGLSETRRVFNVVNRIELCKVKRYIGKRSEYKPLPSLSDNDDDQLVGIPKAVKKGKKSPKKSDSVNKAPKQPKPFNSKWGLLPGLPESVLDKYKSKESEESTFMSKWGLMPIVPLPVKAHATTNIVTHSRLKPLVVKEDGVKRDDAVRPVVVPGIIQTAIEADPTPSERKLRILHLDYNKLLDEGKKKSKRKTATKKRRRPSKSLLDYPMFNSQSPSPDEQNNKSPREPSNKD